MKELLYYTYLLGPDGKYYIDGYSMNPNSIHVINFEELIPIPSSISLKYINKVIPNFELLKLIDNAKNNASLNIQPKWWKDVINGESNSNIVSNSPMIKSQGTKPVFDKLIMSGFFISIALIIYYKSQRGSK